MEYYYKFTYLSYHDGGAKRMRGRMTIKSYDIESATLIAFEAEIKKGGAIYKIESVEEHPIKTREKDQFEDWDFAAQINKIFGK